MAACPARLRSVETNFSRLRSSAKPLTLRMGDRCTISGIALADDAAHEREPGLGDSVFRIGSQLALEISERAEPDFAA